MLQQQSSKSPFSLADETYLFEVVVDSRIRLQSALEAAQGYSQVPALVTALADAVTAVEKADAILQDLDTYSD
jgi:hypothetical protein